MLKVYYNTAIGYLSLAVTYMYTHIHTRTYTLIVIQISIEGSVSIVYALGNPAQVCVDALHCLLPVLPDADAGLYDNVVVVVAMLVAMVVW